jgi:hypothetical protein
MKHAIMFDILAIGLIFNLWLFLNSELIEIGDEEKVRILPAEICRKWVSDEFSNIVLAKYAKWIFKITTEAPTTDNADQAKVLHITTTEISNLTRKVATLVPGKSINFKNLVVLDSTTCSIAKYLIGEDGDTLILSKVNISLCFDSFLQGCLSLTKNRKLLTVSDRKIP